LAVVSLTNLEKLGEVSEPLTICKNEYITCLAISRAEDEFILGTNAAKIVVGTI
jgi:hypothetical protein